MITVILNGYRRPEALKEQYDSVMNQTVSEDLDVMLWTNFHQDSYDKFPKEVVENVTAGMCNKNLGVWARFAFALNAKTRFICVLDDDTIPGKKWLENCLVTMEESTGLLGCRGVRMTGEDFNNYPMCQYEAFGAASPSDEIKQVDIMGHCWFFEREWLRAYWAEMPSTPLQYGGEDMHFSYSIQKYLGLSTYVPPHPTEDMSYWGSQPDSAYRLGVDEHAISVNHHSEIFGESLRHYHKKGFSLQRI